MIKHLTGEELVKHIDELKAECKTYNADSYKIKEKCEKFYDGDQWQGGSEKKQVKNFIFSTIEDELPILVDSFPTTDVISTEDNDEAMESAKALESAIQYSYENGEVPLKNPLAVRDSLKTGVGYIYVDWNQDAEAGAGLVSYTVKNWKMIHIDPMATSPDDAGHIIIDCPMRKQDIERMYPNITEEDMESGESPEKLDDEDAVSTGTNGNESHWMPSIGKGDSKSRFSGKDIFLVEECWLRDYSLEAIAPEQTQSELQEEFQQIMSGINPEVIEYMAHDEHIAAHEQQIKELAAQILSQPAEQIDPTTGQPIVMQVMPRSPESITDEEIENLRENNPDVALIFEVGLDHIDSHTNLRNDRSNGMTPVYPSNLRLVIKIGDKIGYDGPPDCDDGMIPLVPYYCYKKSDSPDAIGEVENLIKLQMSINEMDQSEFKGLRLSTNTGWLVDSQSGVDPASLTNDEGIVIPINDGGRCERLLAGQVSPQLSLRKQMDREEMRDIAGINKQASGEAPKSQMAGFAIDRLREQAISRIRLKTRFLELYSIKRLAKLTASRIIKYWTQERLIRLYDNDGNLKTVKYDPNKLRDLSYEIKILPGSMAGMDKSSIYAMLGEQVKLGIIPAKTFIKAVDMPHKSMIIKDLEANDALAMENQVLKEELAKMQVLLNPENTGVNTDQPDNQGL